MMKVFWLGTGSGLNPALGNTSFILSSESSNRIILVDCGTTVTLELVRSGMIKDITDVVITHQHADHIGGLEGFAFMHYFAFKNRNFKRPKLYLATETLKDSLWNYSLKGGMEKCQADDNTPFVATLDTFFDVRTGLEFEVPGFEPITFFSTLHVQNFENYGLKMSDRMYYSGDTLETPPLESPDGFCLYFQDCQFYETPGDVHIPYRKLMTVPSNIRYKMWLVHLGAGYENTDPRMEGFAGFVFPQQTFVI